MKNSFLYKPKSRTTVLYLCSIAIVLSLHLWKKTLLIHAGISVELNNEISLHISNFSISYLLCLAIGFIWLLFGISLNKVLTFGLIVIAVNFLYELYLPLLNTPDIIDAYYGTVGSLLAGIVLILIKQKGLIPKN